MGRSSKRSSSGVRPGEHEGSVVLRFRRSERALHWALAVPFVVCLASAAVLVLAYNLAPTRSNRDVVSWIHRIGGVGLVVVPIFALARDRGDYRVHLANIRHAWGWTLADLKWLALAGMAAVNSKVSLPEQGKFNAGEKLNFMTVMTSYPLFILTGVMIWLPGGALLSWVVHVGLALVVAPLIGGHVYMAVINPGTRHGLPGMITGYVDRQWAKHHYQRWYRDEFGDEGAAAENARQAAPDADGPPLPARTRILCPSCGVHVVAPWEWLVRRVVETQALICSRCSAEIEEFSLITDSVALRSLLSHLEQAHVSDPLMGSSGAYTLVGHQPVSGD